MHMTEESQSCTIHALSLPRFLQDAQIGLMTQNSHIERSYSMQLRRFYISICIALSLFTFFLSPIAAPGHAHGLANTNPITVTSRTYTVHFPGSIDLQASANDPVSTITKASIV